MTQSRRFLGMFIIPDLTMFSMVYRWFWRRQCISWHKWMFYITWHEWDMHWFDYYVVIAVCSDVCRFNDTFAWTSTIVLIVSDIFMLFTSSSWTSSFSSMAFIILSARSGVPWSSLWLPPFMWDYSITWLMGNHGLYITNATRNVTIVYIQCPGNQYRCCIDVLRVQNHILRLMYVFE